MAGQITFDVGLAAKLKQALIRNGITDLADIDWLCEGDNLANVRRMRQGHVVLTVPDHFIDCDADPFLSNGWKVVQHRKSSHFKWDATKVKLHLSKGQQNGKVIQGNKLRDELKTQPVFNANALNYLYANPHLIPEEWKGKRVFFWGTVYSDPAGNHYVRFLYWHGVRWYCNFLWLEYDWYDGFPAAMAIR